MTTVPLTSVRSRRLVTVAGVVQGVGFRPAVYRLAVEHGLAGYVRNDAGGVTIEIEGDDAALRTFVEALPACAPAASRIDALEVQPLAPCGDTTFRVAPSATAADARTEMPADRATCDDCLRELFDSRDRRYRYPFITCTNCGPRFTIIRQLPYDRSRTTMASFAMCGPCLREYEDPSDRRFHAETNACPDCGPRLLGEEGALREAVARLRGGQIVALKGIGGFHLAADARNEDAVARLRERKRRLSKPFAVMVRDLGVAAQLAIVDAASRSALLHPARPVVCLPTRHAVAPGVAPRLRELGVMLPYSPLHHLLLADGPDAMVMTSGNDTDGPIAIDNQEATERLGAVADFFLLHDRGIERRADDSVVRMVASRPQPIRRSRGFVPEPLPLPFEAPAVLAVGADLKNTVCTTRGHKAYLSAHIGDLAHPGSYAVFERAVQAVGAVVVAHDLHPDYRSTRWALGSGLPRIAVQHHHAHIAACLAENGRTDRVIGLAFDGTGCGPAGELWGGEFLVCDLGSFRRAGHVRALALPGGEAAIREPWRLAVAALLDAGVEPPPAPRHARIRQLIERGTHSPRATSVGRWFDAVAALCALRDTVSYEGQAAVELESIAAPAGHPYPYALAGEEIDLRPAVRSIAASGEPAAIVAARFHETLVQSSAEFCAHLREDETISTVALSGGCFQNKRLTERLVETLAARGFEVLMHRRVPPNDGGISFGQAAVAAWTMRGGR